MERLIKSNVETTSNQLGLKQSMRQLVHTLSRRLLFFWRSLAFSYFTGQHSRTHAALCRFSELNRLFLPNRTVMSFRGEIFICSRPGGQVPITPPTQYKNRRKQEICSRSCFCTLTKPQIAC